MHCVVAERELQAAGTAAQPSSASFSYHPTGFRRSGSFNGGLNGNCLKLPPEQVGTDRSPLSKLRQVLVRTRGGVGHFSFGKEQTLLADLFVISHKS